MDRARPTYKLDSRPRHDPHIGSCQLSAFRDRGSLDRRVNCRRVPQPRWVGARRSAKGGGSRRETGVRGGNPAAFVFVPRPSRVRLQ
jgi:hypothetical protein